jgi:hypothetical protein
MSSAGIGKLQRVPLRDVWRHEAYDFTRWLQDNIDVLNEALGLELINVNREQAAGAFSIDLVAEDEVGRKIIIENQLERSNHDHLGKLLTYMVAMEARAAVWIVSDPRPEHVSTIAWLNESSSADFYLLKVEAVRIGASPAAPLLTLIVGPSEETEAVSRSKREFSGREDIYFQWWTKLVALPAARLHQHITPSRGHWISTSSGTRGLILSYVIYQEESGAELYIDRGDRDVNKLVFDQLWARRHEIDSAFGAPLKWERLDSKRASRISFRGEGGYRSPPEDQAAIMNAQVDTMNRLEAALRPYLKGLQLSPTDGAEDLI